MIGKTSVISANTSTQTIVENSAASGKVYKINSVIISNIDGTNDADITVDLYRSSTSYKIASTVTVVADSSLCVISKENSIYLEEGDALRCVASADGDLQAMCSYEEIS
jgi:hypothetical protein